jgi:hypothetical protein
VLAYGPEDGIPIFTAWSFLEKSGTPTSLWIILPCNILASYVFGSLLGGVWFMCYRLGYPQPLEGWMRVFNGFASHGDRRIEDFFSKTFNGASVWQGPQLLNRLTTTQKVAFMYDFPAVVSTDHRHANCKTAC